MPDIPAHTHREIKEEVSQLRKDHAADIKGFCSDIKEIGDKFDAQTDRWMNWSEAQTGKLDEFRAEITKMIDAVRGAVEQKIEIDAHLMGTVQRIEKQFDQFAETRNRDLKELYTMAAHQKDHEKSLDDAFKKIRSVNGKVDEVVKSLPEIVQTAVKSALDEREGAALKKSLGWIAGIIGAVVAEYIFLHLLGGH